jgi:hypothetical protein
MNQNTARVHGKKNYGPFNFFFFTFSTLSGACAMFHPSVDWKPSVDRGGEYFFSKKKN